MREKYDFYKYSADSGGSFQRSSIASIALARRDLAMFLLAHYSLNAVLVDREALVELGGGAECPVAIPGIAAFASRVVNLRFASTP